jgi:stage IV sporulation protein FB
MVFVLSFRLFNMPVTVRGSFLFIAALIGFTGVSNSGDISLAFAWIAIIFISILIHELGHAITARMFGSQVAIELNGLGGLTRWSAPGGELTPGRRALVAAAGSATGLVFGGLVWLFAFQWEPQTPLTAFVLQNLIWVNVFWGLLNWLPIRPLDGGHLLQSFLERFAPQRAELIARIVFTTSAAAALAVALWLDLLFIAVLAGWLLLSELTIGREPQPRAAMPTLSYDDPEPLPSENGFPAGPVDVSDPDDSGEPDH